MFALYLFRDPVAKNVKVSFTVLLPPYPPLPSPPALFSSTKM